MGRIVITGASGQYGRGVTDRLIAAGLGISLLPQSTLPLLANGADIAWRVMQPPLASRRIGVSRMAGRTLSPAAQAFLDQLMRCTDGKIE